MQKICKYHYWILTLLNSFISFPRLPSLVFLWLYPFPVVGKVKNKGIIYQFSPFSIWNFVSLVPNILISGTELMVSDWWFIQNKKGGKNGVWWKCWKIESIFQLHNHTLSLLRICSLFLSHMLSIANIWGGSFSAAI